MSKYIVIGAGILGASTAYFLAKQGAEVIIIDRKDNGQATDAAAGIICPWVSQRRNQAWYQLAKSGAKFYPHLIEQLEKDGETKTGYAKVGALCLHIDEAKRLAMEKRALTRREEAPEIGEVTLLSPEEVHALFPALHEKFAAVHVSGAARVDGRALRDSLLRAAEKNGAKRIHGDASLQVSENRITGVQVDGETFLADTVIVCAGAWANSLLRPLGIDFKVHFQKAQIVHVELPDTSTTNWPVVMPPGDQYILSFENGRIVIGATHENTETFDDRLTAGGLHEVFTKALDTAPGLNKSTFLEARVGFRPFTPGFLPVIGAIPGVENLITANGLGSSGLTMGPYIGSELAKLALGEEVKINLDLYDVTAAL
jgi:D-amino-acid dehydrogenase